MRRIDPNKLELEERVVTVNRVAKVPLRCISCSW
jgi:hypothetical protein